jgi:hypothetical protein
MIQRVQEGYKYWLYGNFVEVLKVVPAAWWHPEVVKLQYANGLPAPYMRTTKFQRDAEEWHNV